MEHGARDKETIGSIVKAGRVLDCFSRSHPSLTVAEICRETGYSRASVYRLVSTLQGLGWLRRAGDGSYRLGLKLLRLGVLAGEHIDVRVAARPELERLARAVHESTYLLLRENGRAMCVDRIIGDTPVKLSMLEVGQSLPPKRGAASLVFLAYGHSLPESGDYDREGLAARIEQVRAVGFATNFEEMTRGVSAVSAPVLDADGTAVAAVSVGGLSVRFDDHGHREHVVKELQASCTEISRALLLTSEPGTEPEAGA
jgi:DNA-binding IclR family transcriptional regulator